MKTKIPSFSGLRFGKELLLLLLALCAANLPARATLLDAGVDLGAAGRIYHYSIFALSDGITDSGKAGIIGDIAAGGGDGVNLSSGTPVQGNAYIRTGGVLRKSGSATITGSDYQGGIYDTRVNQGVSDAISAAAQANALANNTVHETFSGWKSMTTVHQNTSLSLSAPAGEHVVLHLTDFILEQGAQFTLTGSANTTYVINVAHTFSLMGGKIVLSGGLTAENVLFNITGTDHAVMLSGTAQVNGIILAARRNVQLTGMSSVNGSIIAAKVAISGGGQVTRPPIISP